MSNAQALAAARDYERAGAGGAQTHWARRGEDRTICGKPTTWRREADAYGASCFRCVKHA